MAAQSPKLVLRFAHNIVEHLGLKLYQNKPTNVLAELVSNAWDANATEVRIDIRPDDKGAPIAISVTDTGDGMSRSLLADHYLVVGKPKPREESDKAKRFPMGRKGIGKLAPFGIARTVDVLTVQDGILNWLRFDYQQMLNENQGAEPAGQVNYEPEVIASEASLPAELSAQIQGLGEDSSVAAAFLEKMASSKKGTAIICRDLTLRKPILPKDVAQAMGRRFTVTLLRDDFKVYVNDDEVTEDLAFPKWFLRIPDSGFAEEEIDTPLGKRLVRHWVGFVEEAAWSSDQAGVGVYAHGKIAQDRPFNFENKGNEIFARYMYGVVEADWVDELEHDTISTDRTSIDWNDPDVLALHSWGNQRVRSWMASYQGAREKKAREKNRGQVDAVGWKIRESEKEHLLDLLQEVTPRLPNDEGQHQKLIEATVRAWVHDPARKLIKKLWEGVSTFDPSNFATTVTKLADELVPESLSLGVAFSQRVFALTQLHGHIVEGKETQLQTLIESFPWILHESYDRFTARKALKTLVDTSLANGELEKRHPFPKMPIDSTMPDFVFFSNSGQTEILVVELKGPKATAEWAEVEQLRAYVNFLSSRYDNARVSGLLVSRSIDERAKESLQRNMSFESWSDVLLRSRRAHAELLRAMLVSTDPAEDDARVEQIVELGGPAVREFLETMAKKDPELNDLMSKLKPVTDGPIPQPQGQVDK